MATTVESSAGFAPLHERVTEAMERLHVPGVSLGIIVAGQEHLAAFGITNVNYPSPVIPETLFQIGSTTKTFTATVIMRLVEQGKVELDAPVRTYLPELALKDESVARSVSVRQLLNHTAGWSGDVFADTGRGDDALAKVVMTMAEIEQVTPLGDFWSYNNSAFYLAGRIIESVTGQTYESATREMLLVPLGMTKSFFFPDEVMVHSFAVGHNVVDDQPVVATPWALPRSAHPAGGITSTAGDQLRYARFQMGDGRAEDGSQVLSAESLSVMQTPTVAAWEGAQMALSWFVREVDGVKVLAHGGSTYGQQSSFLFVPEKNFALTVLTNAGAGARLHHEIEKWAFQEYLGVKEADPEHEDRSPDQLVEFTGRYLTSLTGITLALDDGNLVLGYELVGEYPADTPPPLPPPSRVAFYGEDRIVALDGPLAESKGEFLRDRSGNVHWLRMGGRIHTREA